MRGRHVSLKPSPFSPFLVSIHRAGLFQPLKGTFYNAKKPTLLLGKLGDRGKG